VAQQGSPPRRSSRQAGPSHRARPERPERVPRARPEQPWRQVDAFAPDDEAEPPPWAGPSAYQARVGGARLGQLAPDVGEIEHRDNDGAGKEPTGPGHSRRRPIRQQGGRAALARLRKSRRRVYAWCGTAIVACVVAAGIAAIVIPHSGPKPLPYVTKLLPGEYKSVPDACRAVSPTVLSSSLPGPGRTMTQSISGSGESQCSFTLDSKPRVGQPGHFIVLEVTAQAFQPFAAATGNGSASQNALDNYDAARWALGHPGKHSPLPAAQITALAKTGQEAFTAYQREKVSGILTDVVTVVVLERNVMITVSMQGQESGKGFGPVPLADLATGAQAAAGNVLAQVRTQPTA
jgi:hypothetical protein